MGRKRRLVAVDEMTLKLGSEQLCVFAALDFDSREVLALEKLQGR